MVLEERERARARGTAPEKIALTTEARMAEKRERYERCLPVANDILEDARTSLAVRFRFLDRALWRMPLVPSFDVYGIASDGLKLYYDPEYVVDRFKLSPNEVVRDVIHCLFHCIFRHPFMLYSVLRQPWDVACDIAIEALLLDLVGEAFPSNFDRRAREALKVIRAQVGGVVTAERLYHFFSNEGSQVDLRSLAPMFYRDTHGLWYNDGAEGSARGSMSAARQQSEDREGGELPTSEGSESLDDTRGASEMPSSGGGDDEQDRESPDDEAERDEPADERDDEGGSGDDEPAVDDELAEQWADVSRHIQIELEAHMLRQGEGAGNFAAALEAVNREKHDYAEFLKRFATLHERMRVNPDEFDYIYYTYGLDQYGNMPLIEPLEYKETRAVHDFAIAIDTSESVSGDLVQAFMRKTYNILKQAENFTDRVNIHVIQCDARVQEDTKITSLEELDLYLENLELKGFGGTDFRPVFEYVNLLVEKGEFSDLRGLVYFTDGQGTFPRRQPAYDAVFVFLDDGYSDPTVPPWALKVILDERGLT
ncbi:VWA-like domain-containing protein [Gordonibacter massiliensis (ex Traore et al. 2017)]|uniref:Metallopeptidase n=1 Tax=Gordonibacter massiliensis (ex Traore et al. 2017) TaxID=1841863 RepID=A0A842JM75_9ACTN|nr:metallopeptidase [Gordonibacter massiliensis (ex Traore et al. 2017)]